MARDKYEIREICGDWALDIKMGKTTVVLYFNSRNNAEMVKAILEWEDAYPNKAVPYSLTLTPPNEPLTWEELKSETKINPVYSVKYGWILPITVMDGQPYAQIWFFTSKGFAQTELFYHDTFYRRPPEGGEETKDVHMG